MNREKMLNIEHIYYLQELINIIKVCDSTMKKIIKKCVIPKSKFNDAIEILKILVECKETYYKYVKSNEMIKINFFSENNDDFNDYLNMPKCKKSKVFYNSHTKFLIEKIESDIAMRKVMNTEDIIDFE
jgi:hypothetical protein